MVAAFPLSPLTQQAVSTSQVFVATNTLATVTQAQNYTFDSLNGLNVDDNGRNLTRKFPQSYDAEYQSGLPYLENSAIGAFYDGLYTSYNKTFPYPAATCSTSKCTWSSYRSLGICYDLADVSSQLQVSPGTGCTVDSCANPGMIALPNGLSVSGETRLGVFPLQLNINESLNGLEVPGPMTLAFPHYLNRVADVFLMYNSNRNLGWAYEVVFYYCIQEFSIEAADGVFSTTQTGFWANVSDSNVTDPIKELDEPYETNLKASDDDTLYTIELPALLAIRRFMNQMMTGQVIDDGYARSTTGFGRVFSSLGGVFSGVTSPQQTSEGKLALEAIMQNIARSLSN